LGKGVGSSMEAAKAATARSYDSSALDVGGTGM